jgi:hypothetical protein
MFCFLFLTMLIKFVDVVIFKKNSEMEKIHHTRFK